MMVRKASVVLATCAVALAAAACSSGDRASQLSNEAVTIAGCLTTSEDGRAVLTAAPDQGVSAAARAGTGDRETHTYVLVGGENLQAHVGSRIEVTGRVSKGKAEVEGQASSDAARTSATRPDKEARVQTTEQLDVQVRELAVDSVREVAPTCQLNP